MKTCPTCTAAVHPLASFCASCGTEFHGAGIVPRESAPPPPKQPYRPWVWALSGGVVLFFFFLVIAAYLAVPTFLVYQQRANAVATVTVPTATNPIVAQRSKQNLQQIGLALHNYHDVYRAFPAGGIFDTQGAEFHSWQSALLPFLGYSHIYQTIDYDLPWNAEGNQWVFGDEIREYLNPAIALRFNKNDYALSHYAGNSQVFPENQGMSFREMTDGTANTIIAGEVADGFAPWGYPRNVRNPEQGLNADAKTFGGINSTETLFLKADGSTLFLSNTIDPSVLKALSTPAGGETTPEVPKVRNPQPLTMPTSGK